MLILENVFGIFTVSIANFANSVFIQSFPKLLSIHQNKLHCIKKGETPVKCYIMLRSTNKNVLKPMLMKNL